MPDVRDALRSLRATPLVTAVAILSLALGIGANTAIFSIVNSLLLRALPVFEPERLALVTQGREARFDSWTYPIWEQIKERESLWDGVLAWAPSRFNLAQRGETELVNGLWASGSYFEVLGIRPMMGRTFARDDDRRGGGPAGPVAVISYGFWQRRFAGSADTVGQVLTIERVPYTIIGVTPPGFFGTDVGRAFDVAIPFGTEPLVRGKESALDRRSMWWLNIMVRRKPGQDLDAAVAALRGVQPQVREATIPEHYRPQDRERYLRDGFALRPAATGASFLRQRYQRPLLTIMVVVALVLLIACANIANLLLARATARRHELSVRVALGASRWRLARQLLAESLLLSAAGAILGLAFARWAGQLLVRQLSTQVSTVYLDLSIDWRMLAFTALAAAITALLFGTAPAFRATRVHAGESLKAQGRGVAGDSRWSLGNVLVIVQVALSLILVVAAGLFVGSFVRLASVSLGFDRDAVLIATLNVRRSAVEPVERAALYERIREAVARVPGVRDAAVSVVTPVSGSTWTNLVTLPHRPDLPEADRAVHVNMVSPRWFATYGTRLLAGRDFDARDVRGSRGVAIVNQAFARKYFDRNPVGREVGGTGIKPEPPREIIGMVADAIYRSAREPVPPTMYVPLAQVEEPSSQVSVSVRSAAGSPALLARGVSEAIGRTDRDLAITFRLLGEQVSSALTQERLVALLSGFFGVLALLLAGLGLYGVTAYSVSRRRAEIGIRMALGAQPAGIVLMVLRRVTILVSAGVLVGATLTWWAARFVATLLYGLEPRDLATILGAIALLIAVGAIAGWVPAARAARIDPAGALRES